MSATATDAGRGEMVTEERIDILNEPVEQMTEERLRLVVGLLRKRVAYYEQQNAELAATNDKLREGGAGSEG